MALVLKDRVQEVSTTSGTGTLTLSGAVIGFQTFSTAIGNGNTTFYTIYDNTAYVWEVGIGTVGAGTLSRDVVLSNSSGNTSPLTLAGNSVFVWCDYPSEKSVNLDASGNVTPLGTIASGTWQGTTVGVSYGGTGVTASSGANSVVLRDANQNIQVNSVTQNLTSTVSAGGTTTLTPASPHFQILTGTTTQTFKLPDATSLAVGSAWIFDNDSTGNLYVTDNANGPIDTVAPGGYTTVFLETNGTVAGEWGKFGMIPSEVNWGTNSLDLGGSTLITNGTWNGTTIGTAYGGTGLTSFSAANYALYSTSSSALTAGTLPVAAGGSGATTFTANGVVYGDGTNPLGVTAAGTTGQVLIATTGSAPSWGAIPTTAAVTSFQTSLSGLTPSTATTGAVTLAGTLGVSSGGTGTATSFTTGSVVFAGASGVYSQNNTGFFWDNSNSRLGIGTSAPSQKVTINSNTVLPSAGAPITSNIWSVGADGVTNVMSHDSFGIGTSFIARRSNGTAASPTALAADNSIFQFAARGYGATGYSSGGRAQFAFLASENWSDTAQGTYITFNTTLNGTTTNTERMRIDNAGNVGIGTTSPSVKLDVIGSIKASAAATQDGVILAGRAGGTSSFSTTLTPTTLTASRTVTFPDANIDFTTGLGVAQGGTGQTTYTNGQLLIGNTTGNTLTKATLTGTANQVTVTNGSGSITLSLPASINVNTTGSAATLTTPRAIYGNNFDGSAALTQIIASTYGGTGNGFTKFSGATTAEKTYTLPDSSTTILTTANAVTSGQGGTGFQTYTTGDIIYASATNTLSKLSVGSTNQVLTVSGGVPTWSATQSTMVYPGAGIPNSTGSAWGTSYSTTGSGTVVALATSPSFTTPVLGTPTSGTLSNCTVDGTDSVGFRNIPVVSKSAAYTTVLSDAGKTILHPSTDANARTFTIDSNANVAYPVGTAITFINMTSQVLTIAITSDTMYLAGPGTTGSRSLAQYGMATAVKLDSTTWIISGINLT